jgi:hypothetical protein
LSVELPRGRLLLVSPHLDDAALSCAALLRRAEPLEVLTVFAGEPDPPQQGFWDHATGFASSAESMPARFAEDRAAFTDTPHRVAMLSLLELQYVRRPRSAAEAAVVTERVRSWLEEGEGTVAAPAGAGSHASRRLERLHRLWRRRSQPVHPDHVFTRDAVLAALAHRPEASILLYEELPYRWGGRADREVERVASQLGRRPELLVVAVDKERKAARLRAYASQLPQLVPDGTRLDDPGSLPPDERYWWLRPSGKHAS